jgi:uncharacterized membrane protein
LVLGVVWLFNLIDGIFQPIIRLLFGRDITGLGLLLTLMFIYLTGIIFSNVVGRSIIRFGESLVNKLPVLGQLYNGLKQVASSIAGTSTFKSAFREVVLVEYPTLGIFTIGYITNKLNDRSLVSEDQIFDTDLSMQQSLEMTISVGLLTPSHINIRRRTPGS